MKEKISKEGDFMVFCTEQYKDAKNLTGVQVKELFSKYKIWDYLYSNFELLHITGEKYIIDDIDIYIDSKKKLENQ